MEMWNQQRRMKRSRQREIRGMQCLGGLDKKIFQRGSNNQLHQMLLVGIVKRDEELTIELNNVGNTGDLNKSHSVEWRGRSLTG